MSRKKLAPAEDQTVKPEATGQGRPRKISSPEVFDALVDDYVSKCQKNEEPILLLGMCLHLGLYGKEALYEYGCYDGFSQSVKRARAIVEHEYEKRLNTTTSTAAPIFALKNFGWSDQQQLNVVSDNKTELSGVVGVVEVPGLAERLAKFNK